MKPAISGAGEAHVATTDGGADTGSTTDARADTGAADTRPPDAAPDAGCTANIAISPDNCGACGHSCGGGMCNMGVCQATTVAAVGSSSGSSSGPSSTIGAGEPDAAVTGGISFNCTVFDESRLH